ncbi:S8 family serine peptidase [Shewanella mangrovisoli]|uniref:S8 family serine peptidase n=1 Tax=Shewanella mangrovisoli TaxID=2864211 RepID=UPI001C658B7D|nr:S8 family serine peptidase [Shewanella mangrovisoli]QYK08404.1 S8 family serine peptidase [Shewanella mangrovisoli]
MKLKLITYTVAAALYGAGAMQAAASIGDVHKNQVQKIKGLQLTPQQINELNAEQIKASENAQGVGLNIQINPQSQKFQYEEGLTGEQVYIVRLNQKPLAQVSAELLGTANASARRVQSSKLFVAGQPANRAIQNYRTQLLNSQKQVLADIRSNVGARHVRQQFTNAVNGFSIAMTQEEALRVAELPNVASVRLSKIYSLQSDAGPQLIQADKIWTGESTPDGLPYQGEGVIMGIIDTGVNTDHRSFAVQGDDGYKHINPWGTGTFVGDCTKAGFETLCNDKLIGVRSYPIITDNFINGNYGVTRPAVGEDYQGHGSHTASTAAGNVLLNVDYLAGVSDTEASDGRVIKAGLFPRISGVAPHANIISYQVCYPDNHIGAGCPGEALVAGIEDAIKDGVDVINFSIGGQESNPWASDVELAFLAAREAGISVAVAAGNSGQYNGAAEYFGKIDHSSPWLLSAAATTHDRVVDITTKLVNPIGGSTVPTWTEITGGVINNESVTGHVVMASSYGDEYCANEFAADTFVWKDADGNPTDENVIVACRRNSTSSTTGIARSVKADNVKAGGADGMILYNYAAGEAIVPAVSYSVPSIHITQENWGTSNSGGLFTWLRKGTGHELTITATDIERRIDSSKADWLAPFSSRGPSTSTPEALIPAVAAPGVDIFAAYADEHPFDTTSPSSDFAMISGTSMASPHVAGSLALIRQAHPTWTATEVQSALAMTTENKVQYRRLNAATGDVELASTYRAGTGRINVKNAVNAGFVMDETIDNFKAADPNNGGVVHKLNIPQLVNFECKPKCQWIRTIRATKDGSWSVTNGDVVNWNVDSQNQAVQNGVTIKASPSEFTLKAGESMDIVIEASIMDTQDPFSNAEVELHSNLIFSETSNNAPEAHWPIVFKYDNNDMPSNLQTTAHRNNASAVIKGINLPEGDSIHGRIFEPVKAEVKTATLPKDDESIFPWSSNADASTDITKRVDEATKVEMIDVPAGSRRLIVETLGKVSSPFDGEWDKGNILIYVGKDYNGNGQADPLEEILCVSNDGVYNNFCNINEPDEGTYWAIFYNPRKGSSSDNYNAGVMETFQYATTVVSDQVASNMGIEVPVSNGTDAVAINVNWDMPEMSEGDIYYSLVDFGTSAVNAGNIGKVSFKLIRGVDDVNLDVTQTKALVGQQLPFTFQVQPNESGADRAFTIEANIPEGLTLKAEDVYSSSSAIVKDIKVEGKKLTISGVQPNTLGDYAHYNITTSDDDPLCRTPNFGNSNPGGYVDLEEFGIYPSYSGFQPTIINEATGRAPTGSNNMINYQTGVQIPISTLFGGDYTGYHLYNNAEEMNIWNNNSLQLLGTGIINLYNEKIFFPYHDIFPYNNAPWASIGVLWRAYDYKFTVQDMLSVPLVVTSDEIAGISVGSTSSGWGIIEYDNARSYKQLDRNAQGVYQWEERDDRFDFELLFNVNTRFGDGEYELIMAYDNIDFGSQDDRGSIGLQGFKGALSRLGPAGGYKGEQYAWNGLKDKIRNGLVVCYDYVGPESSQFEVTAWTKVATNASGKALTVDAVSQVDGMANISMSRTVTVPSNITVARIANQTIAENTRLEGLKVIYADEQNSVNKITVTGEHISAVVNGNTSGSSITITPEANFHGDVEVTVTVSDVENPADAASTSFMLTVESDGVEPTTPPVTPDPDINKDSGGALGGLSMLLALGALIRRRKTH